MAVQDDSGLQQDAHRHSDLLARIGEALDASDPRRPSGHARVRHEVEEAVALEQRINERHLERTGRFHYSAVRFDAVAASLCLYLEVGEPERGVEALRECLATPDILAAKLPHAWSQYERHLTHLVSAGIECCVDHGAPESLEVARELMNLAVEHVDPTAWAPHMSIALARLHVALGDEESGRKRLAEAFAADPSLRSEPPADPQSSALLGDGPPQPARGFQDVDLDEVARLAAAGALRPTSQYDAMDLRRQPVEATTLGWFEFAGGPMCAYQFETKGRFHLGALRIRKGKNKGKRALSPGDVFGVYPLPEDPRIHGVDLKGKPEAFWIADCDARFGPADAARVQRHCALWQPSRSPIAPGRFEPGPPSPTEEPAALIGLETGLVLADRSGHAWLLQEERWTPLEVHPAWQGRLIRAGADELISLTKQGARTWDGSRWKSESWSVPPDAAVCCLGSTVYAFGGTTPLESAYTDGAPACDDAWAIRRSGSERDPLPRLPGRRSSSTALALSGDRILVAGGTGDRWGNGAAHVDALLELPEQRWTPLPRAGRKYATPRLHACGPGRVVSVGAEAGGRVLGWDTGRRMWFVLGETGVDLSTSASASLSGSVVLVCGGGKRWKPRREAWLVAPDHHRGLLELPPMAHPRAGHLAQARRDGRVLVLGPGGTAAEYYTPG